METSLELNIAMNYFNALFTFISITSLIGCASSIRRCDYHGDSKRTIIKAVSKYGPNGVTEENIHTKHFSGIQNINLTDTYLMINFIDRDYIQKYSTPQKDVIERTEYKTQLTGGMFGDSSFFAQPEKSSDFAAECYEINYLNYEYELDKRVPIGHEWRKTKQKHKILVSGLGKDHEFITENTIDLQSVILNSNPTKNSTLKISCLDCQQQDDVDQSIFNFAKSSITLSYDFNSLKHKIMNPEEQRLADEKIRLQEERRKLGGVPLDDFQNKCLALDFKKGTKDFGDCVLKLNEMK